MKSLMELSPLEIISNYLSTAKKIIPKSIKCSYLDAEILNRKITDILLGYKVNKTDNLDTVTYLKHEDPYNLQHMFDLFENFIRLDVNKVTGITYSEFKNMTVKEQMLLIEYLSLKNDTDNVDVAIIEQEMEEKKNQNQKLYDF